jgi:hypothetical protein
MIEAKTISIMTSLKENLPQKGVPPPLPQRHAAPRNTYGRPRGPRTAATSTHSDRTLSRSCRYAYRHDGRETEAAFFSTLPQTAPLPRPTVSLT